MKPLGPLTEADLSICKLIASLRTASARRNEKERPFTDEYETLARQEEEGVRAEFAFCKHYNLFFRPVFGGKDSYDCVTSTGKRVDIKSVSNPDHNLIAHVVSDKSEIDMYVLVYVDGNRCYIKGWIEKETFIQDENVRNLGHGPSYFLHASRLKPWR